MYYMTRRGPVLARTVALHDRWARLYASLIIQGCTTRCVLGTVGDEAANQASRHLLPKRNDTLDEGGATVPTLLAWGLHTTLATSAPCVADALLLPVLPVLPVLPARPGLRRRSPTPWPRWASPTPPSSSLTSTVSG